VDADFITDGSMAEGDLKPIKISTGQWYQPTDGSFTNAVSQGSSGVFASANYLEWNGLTTFSEFGGASGSNQPLPVELVSFTSTCVDNNTILKWETVSENNSSYFDVEKSTDGYTWRVIGQVSAAGNSNEQLSYSLSDYDNNSNTFYRLNQVDLDGRNEYFGPISSSCEITSFIFNTIPNPSKEDFFLQIYSKEDETVTIEIQDLNGKLVHINKYEVQNGINIFPVNSEFINGVYYIKLIRNNNESFIIKHLIF
jgi:hypothetical protein